MRLSHAADLVVDFPGLAVATLSVRDIDATADVDAVVESFLARARDRLAAVGTESELPEIQAWRRAFSRMGLKPTQYRSASEALLRRLRTSGDLPRIHPLIDVCNAVSAAYAVPIAVIDLDRVTGDLEVRRADGDERYLTFGGEVESPERGEVIYADDERNSHARRWTNRQSGLSAVRETTTRALIVAEALHEGAPTEMARLREELATAVAGVADVLDEDR